MCGLWCSYTFIHLKRSYVTHTHAHTHARADAHAHTHTCMRADTNTQHPYRVYMFYTYAYILTYIHAHTHTNTYAHRYKYTAPCYTVYMIYTHAYTPITSSALPQTQITRPWMYMYIIYIQFMYAQYIPEQLTVTSEWVQKSINMKTLNCSVCVQYIEYQNIFICLFCAVE